MGFMGLMPVVRGKITRDYPDTLGATPYTARLSATFIATPISSFLSHPFDTVKTCMQVAILSAMHSTFTAPRRDWRAQPL